MMKFLFLTVLAGSHALLGCGKNEKNEKKAAIEAKNPALETPAESLDAMVELTNSRSDSHFLLSTELKRLTESFSTLGTPDSNDPSFCYRLGKVRVSSYTLGRATEILAKNWGLSSEQYSKIAVSAKLLQAGDMQNSQPLNKCG